MIRHADIFGTLCVCMVGTKGYVSLSGFSGALLTTARGLDVRGQCATRKRVEQSKRFFAARYCGEVCQLPPKAASSFSNSLLARMIALSKSITSSQLDGEILRYATSLLRRSGGAGFDPISAPKNGQACLLLYIFEYNIPSISLAALLEPMKFWAISTREWQ